MPFHWEAIVIGRHIDASVQQQIDSLIKQSITYGFSKYPELNDYIRMHSQEMNETVMRQHIDLYVNEHSLDLKNEGKAAIVRLLSIWELLHQTSIRQAGYFFNR